MAAFQKNTARSRAMIVELGESQPSHSKAKKNRWTMLLLWLSHHLCKPFGRAYTVRSSV